MAEGWSAPRLWPGWDFACLGGGPSLTQGQVDSLRDRARVIAVNDAYRLAPWADVLYACDWRWWRKHDGVADFPGLKVTLSNARGHLDAWPEIKVLENTGTDGLETAPTGLRTGRNGGYQAINLALHLGAARVLLLGYDMKAAGDGRTHWFGDHQDWPTKATIFENLFLPNFAGLAAPLRQAGVEVINCTPGSALTVFPALSLEAALGDRL